MCLDSEKETPVISRAVPRRPWGRLDGALVTLAVWLTTFFVATALGAWVWGLV